MRALIGVAAVIVAAGGALLWWRLRDPQPRPAPAPTPAPVRATRPAAARPLPPAPTSPADLPAYLDAIEARARANGRVGTEDVRDGVAAIRASVSDPAAATGAINAFVGKCEHIKNDLDVAPARSEVDAVARQLRVEKNQVARERLVHRYVVAAGKLPPAERADALRRIEELKGAVDP